jgi:hypothetical protein
MDGLTSLGNPGPSGARSSLFQMPSSASGTCDSCLCPRHPAAIGSSSSRQHTAILWQKQCRPDDLRKLLRDDVRCMNSNRSCEHERNQSDRRQLANPVYQPSALSARMIQGTCHHRFAPNCRRCLCMSEIRDLQPARITQPANFDSLPPETCAGRDWTPS